MSKDPSTSSFHITGESGSNGTRGPSSEPNAVGRHLKTIARRLMLYPLGKLLVNFEVFHSGADR